MHCYKSGGFGHKSILTLLGSYPLVVVVNILFFLHILYTVYNTINAIELTWQPEITGGLTPKGELQGDKPPPVIAVNGVDDGVTYGGGRESTNVKIFYFLR